MAFFSQNMLEIAMALAEHDPHYEGFILKFVHHWFQIAMAMDPLGESPDQMWDDEDGFFYDVLRLPDGSGRRIEVRSLVGLLPLCATSVLPRRCSSASPPSARRSRTTSSATSTSWAASRTRACPASRAGVCLALVDEAKLRRILGKCSTRSGSSARTASAPCRARTWSTRTSSTLDGASYTVNYEPAESDSGMFGGNSNWRGPVWFPINLLLVRALLQFYLYYGDDFRVECPTGSGVEMTLFEVAHELSDRLVSTFTRGRRRPAPGVRRQREVPGRPALARRDPVLRVLPRRQRRGLGASHQTGWTGVAARLAQLFASTDAETLLRGSNRPFTVPYRRLMDAPLGDVADARRSRGAAPTSSAVKE